MKNNILKYILIFLILIFITILLVWNNKHIDYSIRFNYNSFIYDLNVSEKNIMVKKSEAIQCIKTPCEPMQVEIYTIANNDKYKDFFKKMFHNKKNSHIEINSNELSQEELMNILDIINN